MSDSILLGENLELLPGFTDGSFQMIYIDPPFNTGRVQTRRTLEVVRDGEGERTGFQGRRYRSRLLAESSYADAFADYHAFLAPAPGTCSPPAAARRHAVLPHRLPRGPPLQAAARRDLRARVLPERADLGV